MIFAFCEQSQESTTLHEIVAWDVTSVMELAIEDSVSGHTDLNAMNKDKETAMWYACQFGSIGCARLLKSAGADLTIKDKVKITFM